MAYGSPIMTEREYLVFKRAALIEAKEWLIGRQLIAVDPEIPSGAQEWGRDKWEYPTEESPIMSKEDEYPLIQGRVGRVKGDIFKFGEGFKVPIRDLQSARRLGNDPSPINAQMCGRVLAEKVNSFLLEGESHYNIKGIYKSTVDASKIDTVDDAWDTEDGDPYWDMNESVGTIEANMKIVAGNPEGLKVDFAVFNPANLKYLRTDDAFGNVYWKKMQDNLSIPPERYFASSAIASGDVFLGIRNNLVAEIKESDGVTVSPPYPLPNATIQVNMDTFLGLDLIQANAYRVIRGIV